MEALIDGTFYFISAQLKNDRLMAFHIKKTIICARVGRKIR